ncbi:MAG TPA: hypothetical protein DCR46_09120, partial [Cytophagales bacterium]|nr:hypothetical protein [Cytophagales bacterium]
GIQDKNNLLNALKYIQSFRLSMKSLLDSYQWDIPTLWRVGSQLPFLQELAHALQDVSHNPNFSSFFFAHFQKFASITEDEKKWSKYEKRLAKYKSDAEVLLPHKWAYGVDAQNVADTISNVSKAKALMKNAWGKLQWRYFAKERKEVNALLLKNQLPETLEGLSEMCVRLHNSSFFFQLKAELMKSKHFDFGDEENVTAYFEKLQYLEKVILFSKKWAEGELPLNLAGLSVENFVHKLNDLISSAGKVAKLYNDHLNYFVLEHLHVLTCSDEGWKESFDALQRDFDTLVEYDQAKEKLPAIELQALNELILHGLKSENSTHSIAQQSDDLIHSFRSWVLNSWIEDIETKYPVLRVVSTPTMAFLEQQLKSGMNEKQGFVREILFMRLREQAYRHEEFNRLGNSITFRDLHHQVVKKKKIWPLRKTMENFSNEVFDLLPCWLASPETLSAVFPMQSLFDLVIFDEASQCFPEKGIPAMVRGKQILIAGDSKQLKPSDLYRARFQDDVEDLPEVEIDSLLELGARHLPQVMLTEHYRSRTPELIDFSNRHFYKNSLRFMPDFHTLQKPHTGIEFVKTEGFFENQCNRVEAEKVVQLCLSLFHKFPTKELGVITFNIRQQNIIQDLFEEIGVLLPKSFFVKNIENIQGDEKDIILFSIGYAPDRSGRMYHQFGTLNQAGGENRLNVAVTRAREKVIVVSSIYPQQLVVENTTHLGPKLFKSYLEYAFNVSQGKFLYQLPQENGFRPEWYLKNKLKKRNSLLVEELPFADLVQKDTDGKVQQLVLTDDEKFFNGLSVKETFYYLPQSLEAKNWKFERRWSRNET